MAAYEDFIPYVEVEAPGAGEPLMVRVIRDACIQFCEDSQLFRVTLDPVDAKASVATYTIDTPPGTVISKIADFWYGSRRLDAINTDDISDASVINASLPRTAGGPSAVLYSGANAFTLDRAPDVDLTKGIVIVATLKPTRTSTKVFDQLLEDYAEEIGAGALARLMNMPKQPFTAEAQVQSKVAQFLMGVNKARAKAARGGIGNRQSRVIPRRI